MKRSILLVFAHPDDESFGVSGTVMKYARQGVPTDLVCATRGEKGSRLNVPADIDTGTAREAELRSAAAIIGIRDIYFLGYIDGELDKASAEEVINKVLEIMRLVQPEIVITFGPDGITGHTDHVAIGKAAAKAFERLSAEGSGPRKLYYVTIPESAVPNSSELGIATRPDEQVTISIDITSYLDSKIQAIAAHASQQDTREFIEMLKDSRASGFAEKEYLYLASPRVSGKETDLFQ